MKSHIGSQPDRRRQGGGGQQDLQRQAETLAQHEHRHDGGEGDMTPDRIGRRLLR
ncbi:hypothetical protein [Marinicauda algicola]|uniref:hypothetical protein n=1 Tax=Marinicauda algicola TaxID=2029849 RepID=UPI0019D12516|nr:hypothetical protein [Marinicauda algicola]